MTFACITMLVCRAYYVVICFLSHNVVYTYFMHHMLHTIVCSMQA